MLAGAFARTALAARAHAWRWSCWPTKPILASEAKLARRPPTTSWNRCAGRGVAALGRAQPGVPRRPTAELTWAGAGAGRPRRSVPRVTASRCAFLRRAMVRHWCAISGQTRACRRGRRGISPEVPGESKGSRRCGGDDGPGVPETSRSHLRAFLPFTRAAHSGDTGLGLGLALVRQVARYHGGDVVYIGPPPAAGFEVRLPVSPAQPDRLRQYRPRAAARACGSAAGAGPYPTQPIGDSSGLRLGLCLAFASGPQRPRPRRRDEILE